MRTRGVGERGLSSPRGAGAEEGSQSPLQPQQKKKSREN